jgi:2-keto-4-pentenoate hydratase/2-oxohepta-3-ene-1,7-dioic acid hydratase in catechol pathway
MRVARFVAGGGEPTFGTVELARDDGEHPDTVAAVSGDPLAGPVRYTGERLPLAEVRLLAPVLPRSKVVGVDFGAAARPTEARKDAAATDPALFFKPNTSVIGPGEAVVRPLECERLEYGGVLAVVISRICRRVPAERAQDVIFGYTVANDVTARDLQEADGHWARAKGYDTFTALGPWIATHLTLDEVAGLELRAKVNGEVRQSAKTGDLPEGVAALVERVSAFTTLLPSDVILTGAPAGPAPTSPGDEVSIAIGGIGALTNPVVAELPRPTEAGR